ncbi:hypothetical protein [Paenibacillus sp. NPDC058071]|uniref:hypothetical protein n=1 Tax=Paenibacillus sp. NPDC058071 TaxID=3346326 RepID=UPI0036DA1C81
MNNIIDGSESRILAGENLTITGSSGASGGEYDRVKIVGESEIDGDIACNRLKCTGTMTLNGRLRAKDIRVTGTAEVSDHTQADTVHVSGTLAVAGDARLSQLRCQGAVEVKGRLSGESLSVTGQLLAGGGCEAESVTIRGMFEIGGLLNAGRLDVKLYQNSSAREIGGGNIRIKKASLLNPVHLFFFRPDRDAVLTVSAIEGDEIYLEHTKAEVVRGNQVTIGPGCEIGLVEYKTRLQCSGSAKVAERRQI